jgi:hypothetical protein
MPRVRFEPTIPVFERAKTVHALDRAATMIGSNDKYHKKMSKLYKDQFNEGDLTYDVLAETVFRIDLFSTLIALLWYSARKDETDFSSIREIYTYKCSCFLWILFSLFGCGSSKASENVFV